ncbi:hypothetical protein I545_4891 [Mycobacterium kansasii 662]|uniref:Uncharacterized protein n=1 Tax=Mycobacterium kansasii 662 TaxID=1299326 RepID=X7Z3Y9_MYCKA|nr:hypothetical protein I545_4891 [Mycobacterium kansasii 662]KEP44758.1 hypothetical protein MKSMC1_02190 [Mycobacterium kansasii]
MPAGATGNAPRPRRMLGPDVADGQFARVAQLRTAAPQRFWLP